jgi:hypothetical protein
MTPDFTLSPQTANAVLFTNSLNLLLLDFSQC